MLGSALHINIDPFFSSDDESRENDPITSSFGMGVYFRNGDIRCDKYYHT